MPLFVFCCVEHFIIRIYSSIFAVPYFVYLFCAFYDTVTCFFFLQDNRVTLILSAGRHGIFCAIQTPSVLNYFEHHTIRIYKLSLTSFHYIEHSVTVSLKLYVFLQAMKKGVQESIALEVMESGTVMGEAWAWAWE